MIDTHAHLDLPDFAGDLEAALERAAEAGVTRIVTVGMDLPSSRNAVELAARFPCVYAAVGFHPHEAAKFDEAALAELDELSRRPKVVAIGEIGLDYHRNRSPQPAQRQAFQRQLELAAARRLPVIVHSRDALDDTWVVLSAWARNGEARVGGVGVVHCFSGTVDAAREYGRLGLLVSLAGPITYANAGRAVAVARETPLELLVVETDCPFLAPVPYRGRRSEPAHVRLTVEKIARVRGEPPELVAAQTAHNAERLFRFPA